MWKQKLADDQKRFLDHGLREHAKFQPGIVKLKKVLVKLGGSHLAVPPEPDSGLSLLIQCGFIMTGPVVLKLMEPGACHFNSSRLWVEKKHGVGGIGTGYALSDDGIWRQHSWGVRREGLVETTCLRENILGCCIGGRWQTASLWISIV